MKRAMAGLGLLLAAGFCQDSRQSRFLRNLITCDRAGIKDSGSFLLLSGCEIACYDRFGASPDGTMCTVASTAHTAAHRVRNSIQPAAGSRPEAVDSRPVTVRHMRRAVHSKLKVVTRLHRQHLTQGRAQGLRRWQVHESGRDRESARHESPREIHRREMPRESVRRRESPRHRERPQHRHGGGSGANCA
jgi:hypothetical protein